MKIIGIDPGMSKASTVCMLNDNNEIVIKDYSHDELRELLDENYRSQEKVLIAWDAPLTGIAVPIKSSSYLDNDFTQRKIEQFFSREKNGYKTPKGISVLGYGGCPHWTITQHMLGYPIMGRHQKQQSELPYQLIHSESDIEKHKKLLVEVHPAVALWMWMKNDKDFKNDWIYKGKKGDSNRINLFSLLKNQNAFKNLSFQIPEIKTDDELDALVSFFLAYFLVSEKENEKVMILGNQQTGSFLLPSNKVMEKGFEEIR